MWFRIIVFSLVTVVIARRVQYTEEDAHRDILTIINYAFGVKTNGHLKKPNDPDQLNPSERNGNIRNRVKTVQSINNGSKSSRTNLHKHTDRPIERNLNQRLVKPVKAPPRSNPSSARETFHDVNERRVNLTESRGYDDYVNRSQGQLSSDDFTQTNDKRTNTHYTNNKMRTNENNSSKLALRKNTTPSSQIYNFTKINVDKPQNRDLSIAKNVLLNNVNFRENKTENILQNVVTGRSKEVTINPQTNKISTKKVDEDRWIWDDGAATTTPTPDVGDRAAFAADKCPTGQVKFGDKCIEED